MLVCLLKTFNTDLSLWWRVDSRNTFCITFESKKSGIDWQPTCFDLLLELFCLFFLQTWLDHNRRFLNLQTQHFKLVGTMITSQKRSQLLIINMHWPPASPVAGCSVSLVSFQTWLLYVPLNSLPSTVCMPSISDIHWLCLVGQDHTVWYSLLLTSSLASFRPSSVMTLISLITLILAAASNPSSLTSNSVFSTSLGASSAAGAAAGAPTSQIHHCSVVIKV